MSSHRFACGEDVILRAGYLSHSYPGAIFTIERLLPSDIAMPRYRVKAPHETFSRVVLEDAISVPPISEPAGRALDRPRRAAQAVAEAFFARLATR
jgi:hypothetical protein